MGLIDCAALNCGFCLLESGGGPPKPPPSLGAISYWSCVTQNLLVTFVQRLAPCLCFAVFFIQMPQVLDVDLKAPLHLLAVGRQDLQPMKM